MFPLLLWDGAYFFGGIAHFFLVATLLMAGLAGLTYVLSQPKASSSQPAAPAERGGCSTALLTILLVVAGLLFVVFLLAQLLAS